MKTKLLKRWRKEAKRKVKGKLNRETGDVYIFDIGRGFYWDNDPNVDFCVIIEARSTIVRRF